VLILLFSCSTARHPNVGIDYSTTSPNESIQLNSEQSNEKISVTEVRNDSGYGPEVSSEIKDKTNVAQNKKRDPIVALYLGGTEISAISYILLLKQIEKRMVNIKLLAGRGIGGVIAAMYAAGIAPDRIEWLFYKLEKKSLQPFSKEWNEELLSSIVETCGNQSIKSLERFNKTFILLFKDQNTLRYKVSGKIENLSLLLLPNQTDRGMLPSAQLLKQMGAELVVGIDMSARGEINSPSYVGYDLLYNYRIDNQTVEQVPLIKLIYSDEAESVQLAGQIGKLQDEWLKKRE